MAEPDDETTRSARRFQPGQDLYGISIDELQQIAAVLKEEITRIEREIASRDSTKAAAEALFKNG
ncbi:DUF1192 domain-containing protein [Nitratireductor basaltis]|uniref:DUF1192 domain-containing protein n=1 Tax=Nitratireductor basaltis TaxID=472175 RepID=A0A084U6R1_9HYPH|nr:DUF1192 domain-containing protein [Nitratireductor basaltis]KFB08647.1 hypothetical protein EL18_02900 [Nitratireductor basaltis]